MSLLFMTSDFMSISARRLAGQSALRTFAHRTAAVTKPSSTVPPSMQVEIDPTQGYELTAAGDLDACDGGVLVASPADEAPSVSRFTQQMRMHASRPRPPRRSSPPKPASIGPCPSEVTFMDVPTPLSPTAVKKEFQALADSLRERETVKPAAALIPEHRRRLPDISPPAPSPEPKAEPQAQSPTLKAVAALLSAARSGTTASRFTTPAPKPAPSVKSSVDMHTLRSLLASVPCARHRPRRATPENCRPRKAGTARRIYIPYPDIGDRVVPIPPRYRQQFLRGIPRSIVSVAA